MTVTITLDFAATTGTAEVRSPDYPEPYTLTIGHTDDPDRPTVLPWFVTDSSDADDTWFATFADAASALCAYAIEAATDEENDR